MAFMGTIKLTELVGERKPHAWVDANGNEMRKLEFYRQMKEYDSYASFFAVPISNACSYRIAVVCDTHYKNYSEAYEGMQEWLRGQFSPDNFVQEEDAQDWEEWLNGVAVMWDIEPLAGE